MAFPFLKRIEEKAPLFVDTFKGLPKAFSETVGQPSLRAYAGVADVITGKPLTPSTTFQKELYGTDKPISFRSVGEEVLPQGNKFAPLKALFTGAGLSALPLFIPSSKETYNREEDYILTQESTQEPTQVFREIPFTEETIKQTTASIMSEISNRMKPIEVSAMLHVAINKAKQDGVTLEEVISDPNFFQGVTNQRYQDVLNDNIEGQDEEIKKFVKNTIDKILSGEEKDHTKGATHFIHITSGPKKDAIVTMTEQEFTTYLSKKGRDRDLFAEALLK